MTVFENLQQIIQDIEAAQPQNVEELEQFRIKYLGSKNIIKPLSKGFRDVPNEQKKEFGQLLNKAKQAAEQKFQSLKDNLETAADEATGDDLDLTAPAEPIALGSRHPVSITMNRIIDIFARIGFAVAEEREIEDDWHNFTAMNTPEDHPARDMQDTYYLKDSTSMLLRTHTSSVQARTMTTQQPPIRIIAPGRVYRNETISARSHCQFICDSKGCNVCKYTGWVEILGCGMVDPKVLENCDIDPEVYSGFAFGMGIERQAMMQYGINDIRLLFENDVRFLQQFQSAL